MEDLIQQTNEEIADTYKKKLFLETIKNGKTPRRSGLGSRLYLLAGFTGHIPCTMEPVYHKTFPAFKRHLTKVLRYPKTTYTWGKPRSWDLYKDLETPQMQNVFKKYLKDYYISSRATGYYVYFDPRVTESWGVLDADLLKVHPNKCKISNKGFIYFKTK